MMPAPARPGRYFLTGLFLIIAIVLADQYTKWMAMNALIEAKDPLPTFLDWFFTRRELSYFVVDREAYKTITVTPWLNLVMVWNQGISFGLFDSNKPIVAIILIALSLIVSLVLLIWLALARKGTTSLALMLVIGGAFGNIIDRLRFGAVVDFVDLHANSMHWPAFNLADGCIVSGALLLALSALAGDGRPKPVDVQ